jgi:hypothetical protein
MNEIEVILLCRLTVIEPAHNARETCFEVSKTELRATPRARIFSRTHQRHIYILITFKL